MPISMRFALRPGYDTLQIRITVAGREGSPFSTTDEGKTIQVSGTWDQKKQKRTDRTDSALKLNNRLDKIRTRINEIYERQQGVSLAITPKTVQQEFQTGVYYETTLRVEPPKPKNLIQDIYCDYIARLKSYEGTENALEESTISKWEYGLSYLTAYLKVHNEENLSAEHLSVGWAKDYQTHLMKAGPMAQDSATRYIMRLSEAMDAWVDYGTREDRRFNPLAGQKFGRGKSKEVYFLEKPHIEKFWQLDNRGKAGVCLWWMGLVLLTGLDYPDAVRYIQDRAKYDRPGNTKPSILIRRSKKPFAECRIPVWPELTALLSYIPKGDPPDPEIINDYMKGVEVLIGFSERFTLKIGRKTAGYIFLLRGYTIQAVSRILGHSSIAVTERYYVKVRGELVDQETDNL